MPDPIRHYPQPIALITMTTNEQQSWIGMCSTPAFVECPRTGFFGKMLDAIFGVRTKPNPSKFAGEIVYVNQNGVVVSVNSLKASAADVVEA